MPPRTLQSFGLGLYFPRIVTTAAVGLKGTIRRIGKKCACHRCTTWSWQRVPCGIQAQPDGNRNRYNELLFGRVLVGRGGHCVHCTTCATATRPVYKRWPICSNGRIPRLLMVYSPSTTSACRDKSADAGKSTCQTEEHSGWCTGSQKRERPWRLPTLSNDM